MPTTPSRRRPPTPKPDVSVSVQGDVEGELYVAGGDINVTQYSREDRLLRRTREALIDKVHQFWIEGVLDKSLHGVAMLDLGMKSSEEAVQHPWETVVRGLDPQKTSSVPARQTIVDVFDGFSRALLILGQPGSGKTITLLELADALIDRAREDEEQPIPVILSLSSWQGETISAWVVAELADKYGVPRAAGQAWVDEGELALLLDGLDEVHADHRAGCVEAINKFRVRHGLAPMAVTSRQAEYEAIGKQLALEGAVILQLLSDAQVDRYLKNTGEEYESLRKAIKADPALHELAQTPLMLTVMMLAYRGVEIKDIPGGNTVGARRRLLFDQYIERMLKRSPANAPFSADDTLKYLRWIALRMTESSQMIFMLENIQPGWLSTRFWRWAYNTAQRVVGIPLLAMLAVTITLATMMALQGALLGNTPDVVLFNWGGPLILGGLFFGVAVGVIAGRSSRYDIRPIEGLRWSWGWSWRQARFGALIGLIVSLALSMIAFFFLGYFENAISRGGLVMFYTMGRHLAFWWLFGLGNAVCWAILFGLLFGGLRPTEIETTRPNQGMRLSFRGGQMVGLGVLLGLGALLVPMVTSLEYFTYHEPFRVALAGGTVTGLSVSGLASFVMGLSYGALPVIQHITVRVLLAFVGALPLRLASFLDMTSDLIFTRKVGGGYIFVHRLLLEHMAGIETEEPAVKPKSRPATVDGTAYWFVPATARRQIDFRKVERAARRAGLMAGGVAGLALLAIMLSANLLPNLYAIGGGTPLGGIAATGYVSAGLGWSRDGAQVATVHASDASAIDIDLWDAATGTPIQQPYPGGFVFGGDNASPDGRYWLALNVIGGDGFRDYRADVWVWDLTTGQAIQTLPVSADSPTFPLAWSPDGKRVAVGQPDKITLWDALKGKQALAIPGDGWIPLEVTWAADGSAVSARSAEGYVATYRVADGEKLAAFGGTGAGVGAFSPDGSLVALDDQASDIGYFVFETKTGQQIGLFTSEVTRIGQMLELSWSPDGRKIAAVQQTLTGDAVMTLRDAATGAEIRSMPLKTLGAGGFSWSPDGSLITVGQPNGALAIINAATGRTINGGVWAPTNWVVNLPYWSPDGANLAALGVDDRSVIIKAVEP